MNVHETDHLQQMGDVSVLYVGAEATTPDGLEEGGHIDVTAIRAPDTARERLARNGVDCVVSRYDLPGTDGVEFLETVREQRPRLPLFLLAEEADEDMVEEAIDAGVTDCLDWASVACREQLLARRIRDAATARRISTDDLLRDTERLARTGGWHLDLASGDLRITPGCRRLHGLGETPDGMDALVTCYHSEDQQTLRTALIRAKEATDEVIVVTDGATIETVPAGEEAGGQVYLPELRLQPDHSPDRVVETRIESVTSGDEVVAIRGAVSDATDRRQCEAEVRRYERVADDLPVGVFRATRDGEFVSVNRTLVAMLGADSKIHLHEAGIEKLRAEDGDSSGWSVDLLDTHGPVETDPIRIETLDGETRWVELTLSPAQRDGVEYVDGVVHDVTERRNRLRRLERTERRYRTLAENLPNGAVLMFDADLRYRFAHGELFTHGEANPEDFEGKHISDVFESEALETKRELYETTLDGNRQHTEMRHGGGIYEVYTVPVRDENDEVYAGFVMAQDVTERTEREQRLEATRDRMEFALDATDSYIFETDLQTGEETRHGPFERIHGVDPEAVSTTEAFYERCVHPADRERLRELERVETLTAESGTVEFEYRTERAENAEETDVRWIHTEEYVQTGPDGKPEQLVGLSTDITERKRREESLKRQNERLEQFASVVSHDLTTPLSVASGHLELLREEYDSEHVERALDAIDRSHTLVSDLLTLARDIETVTDDDPVSLATLVERAWKGIDSAGATLVTETTQTLRAERGLLRQLVTNLLRNAVEHGSTRRNTGPTDAREDGSESVTVTVGDLPEGFYVADDGPGIPPEERDDIFEDGYSTGQDNTGLGLAIVREIASVHGWQVAVTESEAGGARFEITGVETVSTDTDGIEEQLGQIDEQARDIYETLDHEPRSISELAAEYDLPQSAVCPRLELLERHDLVESRTRVADDGNAYPVYEATDLRESK